jgi:hypothetical protein
MPPDDYERYRQRLEEQLHSDIGMLYEAFRAKLHAYETILRARRGELDLGSPQATDVPLAPPPVSLPPPVAAPRPPVAAVPTRLESMALIDAVQEVLPQLPEVFAKWDVLQALGFTPSRSTLYLALRTLAEKGVLAIARDPGGSQPTWYRRAEAGS